MPFHTFNVNNNDPDAWSPIHEVVRIPADEIVDGDWSQGKIHLVYADDSQKSDPPYYHASVFRTDHDVTLDIAMHGQEFSYIVEGEMSYEDEEGVEHVFTPGTIVYLDVKTKGIMKYKAPFCGVQVIFYPKPEPDRTDGVSAG